MSLESELDNSSENPSNDFLTLPTPGVYSEEPEISALPIFDSPLEINHLAENAKELLAMLWLAGGCLPSTFFERADHNVVWGPQGAAIFPGSGAPEGYDQIIQYLAKERLIIILPRNGSEALLMTHPELSTFFFNHTQVQMERWKYLAAKAIVYAYPKDPQLLPIEYVTQKFTMHVTNTSKGTQK